MRRILRKPEVWRLEGGCLEYDPDLWYPEKPADDGFTDPDYTEEQVRFPKSICATCPVQPECLEYGLKSETEHGVFGGATPAERRRIILDRARARRA